MPPLPLSPSLPLLPPLADPDTDAADDDDDDDDDVDTDTDDNDDATFQPCCAAVLMFAYSPQALPFIWTLGFEQAHCLMCLKGLKTQAGTRG